MARRMRVAKAPPTIRLADVRLVLSAAWFRPKRKAGQAAQVDFFQARAAFTDRATPAAWARLVAVSHRLHAAGLAESDVVGPRPANVAVMLRRHELTLEAAQAMSDAELLRLKGIGPLIIRAIRDAALPPRAGT